jgi:hypothetical protein
MRGAIPPLPQYAFMAWCLVKAQRQLYLLPFVLCGCESRSFVLRKNVYRRKIFASKVK